MNTHKLSRDVNKNSIIDGTFWWHRSYFSCLLVSNKHELDLVHFSLVLYHQLQLYEKQAFSLRKNNKNKTKRRNHSYRLIICHLQNTTWFQRLFHKATQNYKMRVPNNNGVSQAWLIYSRDTPFENLWNMRDTSLTSVSHILRVFDHISRVFD